LTEGYFTPGKQLDRKTKVRAERAKRKNHILTSDTPCPLDGVEEIDGTPLSFGSTPTPAREKPI